MSKRIISYLDSLYEMDYKERPVSVEMFICDDKFLGKVTNNGKAIYNIWKQELNHILNEDSKTMIVLTGGIGTGKTNSAIMGMCFVLHKLLCLKDPWGFFNLSGGDKMSVAFFNLTKDLGKSKGFNLLQSFLLNSSWFKERSTSITGTKYPVVNFSLFEYILASPYSKGFGTIGAHVVAAIMDEVDSPTESVKQKERVLSAYKATSRRFESRFVIGGESIGKFFLVASKQDDVAFLNTFVDEMKGAKNVHVVDIPLWEAKPAANYCGEKFTILIGDAYTKPKILSKIEADDARKQKLNIIDVPIEHRISFEQDIVGALRDIAGISTAGARRRKLIPSEEFLLKCYDIEKPNPMDRFEVITDLRDSIDFIKYIDLSKLRVPKEVPRYIHEDIAFTNDAVGLGCSCVKGYKTVNVQREDGTFGIKKVKLIETDFAIRFVAKAGNEIPAFKVRKFILDLRSLGLNIQGFTADLRLASADTFQILTAAGIKCDSLSLDKSPQAYLDFRSLVFEERWTIHPYPFLHFELKHLEIDETTGKVDHPEKVKDVEILADGDAKEVVMYGSKDLADGVVGSVIDALWGGVIPPPKEQIMEIMSKVRSEPIEKEDLEKMMQAISGVSVAGPKTIEDKLIEDSSTSKFVDILKKIRKG